MRRVRAVVLGGLLLAFTPALARADTSDVELAKRYFKLGQELYRRSDYAEALAQFEKSYQHSKQPALLYNMARCKESLGDLDGAIALYEQYRATSPPDAEIIDARITNLRRLAQQKRRPDPGETKRPAPIQPAAAVPTPMPTPTPRPAVASTPEPTERPSAGRPLRLTGWVVAGAGVALVATGIVLGALAKSTENEIEQGYADGSMTQLEAMDKEDRGKALEVGQIVTLAVGGVAVAAGAALLIWEHRSRRAGGGSERRAWLLPTLTPGGAQLSAGLRF